MRPEHHHGECDDNMGAYLGQDGDPGGPELLGQDQLLLPLQVHVLERVRSHG